MRSMLKIADMHCHIIPGVDDGAKTFEESMAMITSEYEQGVRVIIMTPHWRKGMFTTDRGIVYDQFLRLQEQVRNRFPDLQIFPGCEFHVNADMIKEIGSDGMMRMNATDSVLTEFSEYHEAGYIRNAINQEISSGFIPIIAHIERYPACIEHFDFIFNLRKMGAKVQINADSVVGKEGRHIRRAVLHLLDQDFVDFIGSDAHNMKDRGCHLLECEKVLLKKFGPKTVNRLMWENPNEMIEAAGE